MPSDDSEDTPVPPGLLASLAHGLASVRQRNVLQPLIYIFALVTLFALVFVYVSPGFATACFILVCVLLAFSLLAYGFFAITSPDRLQTETYQLRSQQMRYEFSVESKGGRYSNPIDVTPVEIPALPSSGEGQRE